MKDHKIVNMNQPIGSTTNFAVAIAKMSPIITIGDFTISDYGNDTLWIERSDGEGGQFKIALFEKAVEEFYNEHF